MVWNLEGIGFHVRLYSEDIFITEVMFIKYVILKKSEEMRRVRT